ncbi:hypothetical protein K1T71_007433 [Dendrolimus kikuchii]|uniref:Uncharacterized protein n=1 Tax=Dendrolimus kikuchii TaxID=765133 RepID=A0ACC1D0F6_9NEOP|nr:hypothetical protein K1T71_007433 [Dendrolimus kikuchii]
MEIANHIRKFKVFLERILHEKYELSNYHSENLLKYLEDSSESSAGKVLLETPAFSDLIFYSLENIQNATTSVKIFIIKIITILYRNELQFSKLQMQGIKLCTIRNCVLENLQARIPSPVLQEACLKVAIAQVSHISGLKFIVELKLWEKIIYPEMCRRPKRVAKAAYEFVSTLLWTLNDYEDEETINEIMSFLIRPINNCAYQTIEVLDTDDDDTIAESILTSLHVMFTVLDQIDKIMMPNKLLPIIRYSLTMSKRTHRVFRYTRNPEVVSLLSDSFIRYDIANAYDSVSRHDKSYSDFYNEILPKFLNIITLIVKKRMVQSTLDYVVRTNILWTKVKKKLQTSSFQTNGQTYEIENQLLMLVLVPLVIYVINRCRSRNESKAEEFYVKLGQVMTEHIVKSSYIFRAVVEESDLKQIAIQAVKELFKLQGHLNSEQAGILFQCLYYILDLFVVTDGDGGLILSDNPLESTDDVKLLALVLDATKMLLKEHNIRWYENVEIISLQTGLMNLLKQNILPSKQLLQVMDLIDLSIKKFLSPDMTLLVESQQGSALNEIGGVMKALIQHEDWEVRDSALSLLLSCTEIAFVKYVPLQKLICENDLISLAIQAAFSDTEFYAQITALKCLAAATKIESIWREVLASNPNIYRQLVYIVRNNPEGMVRREAVNVLTQVYTNQKVPENFCKSMYAIMSSAALDDLYWEVQLAALNFWKHTIQSHLVYRGMVNGRFPSVTFSKEKRKIIVLNEKEIERQLIGIMNNLSTIGCLTVLKECMKEDYNIEVMEQAYSMAKDLLKILEYYKFEKVPNDTPVEVVHNEIVAKEKVNIEEFPMDLSLSYTLDMQEKVIGSILDTQQSDLIIHMHDSYVEMESNRMDEDVQIVPTNRDTNLHPNVFLEFFKRTDYVAVIQAKKTWNKEAYTLDSLLDEVMGLEENYDILPSCD